MIDFPNSPAIGQVYNPGTGPIYIWDGVGWNLATSQTRTARQKNLVGNPAMEVSQENGSAAVTVSAAYPVDQWCASFVGPGLSVQQVVSYTPDLSPNRIRKTVTALKASLAAGDLSSVFQGLEGNRIACLGYGTAAAMQSVLRFGFRGPAGTYSFALRNGVANRSYVKNFTISAAQANTDTLQVFTIPGDTAGTWVTDNTVGAYLQIVDAVGTTNQGVEGWQAGSFVGTAANSNMVATNGNVVELFDVGLYPDPEKTGLPPPFIAPSYAQALQDCMRYYWKGIPLTGLNYPSFVAGSVGSWTLPWKVPMRVNPTVGTNFPSIILNGTTNFTADASSAYGCRMISSSTQITPNVSIGFGASDYITANARM